MLMVKRFLLACAAILIILFIAQIAIIFKASKIVSYDQPPFERRQPSDMNILFLGDSTALGTGSTDPRTSVAGWFGQAFPNASITNISANGKTLDRVAEDMSDLIGHYDLLIIQAGGNDIIRFRPLGDIKRDLTVITQKARQLSDKVVLLHSGDVGLAPIFIYPFKWIYSWRTRQVRELFLAQEQDKVHYVDLLKVNQDRLMARERGTYYAPDGLHLSGTGYKYWFDCIMQEIKGDEKWRRG